MLKSFIFSLLCVLLITSCTEEPEESKDIEPTEETPYFDDGGAYVEAEFYPPPTIRSLSRMMKMNFEYNAKVLPSVELRTENMSENQKHLNFGLRRVDMEYLIATDHTADFPKHLETYNELAVDLELGAAIDYTKLSKRLNANLENKDSVQMVYTVLEEGIDGYLYENDQTDLQTIHFTGGWIETSHFLLFDWEARLNQTNWRQQMMEQFSTLGFLIKGLKILEFDIDANLISDLESLNTAFESFQSVTDFYEDENAEEVIFTADEVAQLNEMIEDLREKILAG